MQFRIRPDATQYVREKGVPMGDGGLKDLANRGRGPRYSIINGRAVYTDADLDAWIEQQCALPVPKRGRRKPETIAAADRAA